MAWRMFLSLLQAVSDEVEDAAGYVVEMDAV
jgi:hypothetical protein